MTISIWVSLVGAVIAGLFAAIVAPLVTSWLARRNWRAQKHLELKYEIFKGATAALAAWLTDALDVGLQSGKAEWKGMSRQVEMRPATSQALEHYRGLVAALFSDGVSAKYDEACRAKVSLDNVPNVEFEDKRVAFVEAAAAELGLEGKDV
jgi:hypothetical protein